MDVSTPVRQIDTGLHQDCWRLLSRATALGCPPVSYLVTGSPVPEGDAVLHCHTCGDSWTLDAGSSWVVVLRRVLLAAFLAAPDAA